MNKFLKVKSLQKSALLLLASCSMYSCAPGHATSIENASQNISSNLGCKDVKSKVFDSFYEMVDQDHFVPNADELKSSLDKKVDEMTKSKKISDVDAGQIAQLKTELHNLVEAMLSEADRNPHLTAKDLIQKLIAYEMEDQSDINTINSSQKIAGAATKVKALGQAMQLACAGPVDSGTGLNSTATTPAASPGKVSKGIDMVFATAYQSCRVLDLPAMDRSTASVVGITRVGTHADGIGGKREVTNLSSVQKSHYYINGIATESQCAPVRNNPLIYDYGGEPAISKNTISFQTDAGSGTKALGVDCSAYVSSTIAVAGLRYKPELANKPIFIRQTSSSFISAAKSGFTCFENVTVSPTSTVKPGDIIGVSGHVVAIDKVGADPFGLSLVKSVSECSNLDYRNFDITITQSSPSKNGIGINKYILKDYLLESGPSGKMTVAFVGMGQQACLAKFQNKSIKPASSAWGFLRHKGTPECLAPRVSMVGESCTQKCL